MFGAFCIAVAMSLHRSLREDEKPIAKEKYNDGWTVQQLVDLLNESK